MLPMRDGICLKTVIRLPGCADRKEQFPIFGTFCPKVIKSVYLRSVGCYPKCWYQRFSLIPTWVLLMSIHMVDLV